MSGALPPTMPAGVPQGGLPPGMTPGGMPRPLAAPQSNLGPASIPQSNPGNISAAVQKLVAAHKLILEALPAIPLGMPLHTAAMKVASDLDKHLGQAKEQAQTTVQTLLQALRANPQDSQMAMLQRMMPQANQPPAMQPAAPAGGGDMAAAA